MRSLAPTSWFYGSTIIHCLAGNSDNSGLLSGTEPRLSSDALAGRLDDHPFIDLLARYTGKDPRKSPGLLIGLDPKLATWDTCPPGVHGLTITGWFVPFISCILLLNTMQRDSVCVLKNCRSALRMLIHSPPEYKFLIIGTMLDMYICEELCSQTGRGPPWKGTCISEWLWKRQPHWRHPVKLYLLRYVTDTIMDSY